MSMELTGGQSEAGEPAAQLAGVVARISRDSGVNAHEDWLGKPEHERVTNMGAVRAALSSGVRVTAMVPESPAVTVSGSVEGATGARVMAKLGVELLWPVTSLVGEIEMRCAASPR